MEVESRAPRGRGTPGRPGACKYRAAGGGGAGGRDSASWARDVARRTQSGSIYCGSLVGRDASEQFGVPLKY